MLTWDQLRQRLSDVPSVLVDGAIATGIVVVTSWLGRDYHTPGFREFDTVALALTCLANLPLALRRRAPMLVLLTSCAAVTWFFSLGYVPSFNVYGPLLALYTVAAMRSTRTTLVGVAVTAGVLFASGLVMGSYTVWSSIAQALVSTAVAWLFGTGARRLADRNQRLLDLTEQLRREREDRAHRAVVAERVRIARELHDVVAHHVSVVSVQANLARYVLSSDLATTGRALDTIVDTSHEALEEMRRMLALLRISETDRHGEGRSHDPAPGLARLDELVERVRRAGVPVRVVVVGTATPLPSGADLCAYRIVQESLTNVLKHARGAQAVVRLDYGEPGQLTMQVSDDGPGAAPGPVTGHGLVGMGERAALYGGILHAGPGPAGGFVVTLTLPVPAIPAVPANMDVAVGVDGAANMEAARSAPTAPDRAG